jgi:flagellar motor protein MotB
MNSLESKVAPTSASAPEARTRETRRFGFASYALLVALIAAPALIVTALTLDSRLNRATADAHAARSELAAQTERNVSQQAQLASLKRQTEETRARVREDADRLRVLASSDKGLSDQLEAANDAVGQLRMDLERFSVRLGPRANGGAVAWGADAGAGPNASDPACGAFVGEVRAMSTAGLLENLWEGDSLVLRAASDALFDATAALRPDGRALLQRIAGALVRSGWNAPLAVAVYADDRPPAGGVSSWQTTSAQASRIVDYLRSQGVQPAMMSAVGYGSSDPISDNLTPAGREANNRVEIVLATAGHCGPEVRDGILRR